MTDLSDHDGPVTKTGGFMDEVEKEPERGDFEIGIKDGEGYIKIPAIRNNEVMEFPTSKSAIERYTERRDEVTPFPSLPDGIEKEANVEAPGEWDIHDGTAIHTGGNIYCRSWKHERENVVVEILYGLPKTDGISITLYDKEGEWIGEVHVEKLSEFKHDKEAQNEAVDLIERYVKGEFEDEIKEMAPS